MSHSHRRGGHRGGHRGGVGGGGGHGNAPNQNMEKAAINVCTFFVASGGQCKYGDNCTFSHNVVKTLYTADFHSNAPVKALSVFHADGKINLLSGSTENALKVLDVASPSQSLETVQTKGSVSQVHVDKTSNDILFAVDEPMYPEKAEKTDLTVGVVHKLMSPHSTVELKRSEDMPYTHPHKVTSLTSVNDGGNLFVITGGGEGIIRLWKSNGTIFECIAALEGHTRDVTCLVMKDKALWSGSNDRSIRVWDLNTCSCIAVFAQKTTGDLNGHTDSISSLALIPAIPNVRNEDIVVSGGYDTKLLYWDATNGQYMGKTDQPAPITSLLTFINDEHGGPPALIIGLKEGGILVRSCTNFDLLFTLDTNRLLNYHGPIWSLTNIGFASSFASGAANGKVTIWQVLQQLP